VTFIIACVGVRTSSSPSPSSSSPSSNSGSSGGCKNSADLLWGDAVYELDGKYFQVIGDTSGGLTWKEASFDAGTRCYKGKTGSLTAVASADVNDFLHRLGF
jgi:hypothetical protein